MFLGVWFDPSGFVVFAVIFSAIATLIVMAAVSSNLVAWLAGGVVYLSGKIIVVSIIMGNGTGGGLFNRRGFYPFDGFIYMAVIFTVQSVIWCIVSVVKGVNSRY